MAPVVQQAAPVAQPLSFARPAIVPLGKKIVPLGAPAHVAAPVVAAPAPAVSAPMAQGNPCAVCSKAVYLMDQIKVEDTCYHRWCFRCCECQATLKAGNYASAHGSLYCKAHFKQLFALKGNYDEGFGTEKHTVKVCSVLMSTEGSCLRSGPEPRPLDCSLDLNMMHWLFSIVCVL